MVRRPGRTLATVLASSGGAPTVTETTDGPTPSKNSVRDTAEKRGDGGGSALFLRWEKTVEGAHLGFLYRGKSLGARGEIPQIHRSTESKIAPKFVTDSVLDANSQRPRDKTLGTSRSVGVLDDHGNASRCGIQMDEWRGAQVKVAADGGRQATSRGRVGTAPGYAGVTS
jgi:hypothetical protein